MSRTLTVSGSAGLDPSTAGSHQKLAGRPGITITFSGLHGADGCGRRRGEWGAGAGTLTRSA